MFYPSILLLIATSLNVSYAIKEKHVLGMRKILRQYDTAYPTCRLVFFSDLADYDTADKNCRNLRIMPGKGRKGKLVTVKRIKKNHDLQEMLSLAYPFREQPEDIFAPTKWVWTGLRKVKNNQGQSEKGLFHNEDWVWADGSTPNKFYLWLIFSPEQKVLDRGQDGCDEDRCYQNQMAINHEGLWDDTFKFIRHPYACDYRGKYFLSDERKTWHEAKVACEDAGMHLAKIRSPAEVEEIKEAASFYLKEKDPDWRIWNQNNWIWTGGNDFDHDRDWRWLDGTPVEDWDIPWKENAGNDNANFTQHALAISRWGEFDDSNDNDKKRRKPFACQCPDTSHV